MMLMLKRLNGIIICLLILGGCATHLEKNNLGNRNASISGSAANSNGDTNALYQKGKNYQNNEQYAEAIAAYEQVLALNAEHYDAYNGMGVIYSILGEHELAIQLISEAVNRAPLASYLHNNLGYAYLQADRASEAAGAFHRALRLDPENVSARQNLSKAYEKLGCVENKPCGQWQDPEYR